MNLRILGAVLAAVLTAACSKPEEPAQPLRTVRVMNLDAGDNLVDVARVVKEDDNGTEEPTGDEAAAPADETGGEA
mgnify:CR=1 FL=1